jgi:hypothetical protein
VQLSRPQFLLLTLHSEERTLVSCSRSNSLDIECILGLVCCGIGGFVYRTPCLLLNMSRASLFFAPVCQDEKIILHPKEFAQRIFFHQAIFHSTFDMGRCLQKTWSRGASRALGEPSRMLRAAIYDARNTCPQRAAHDL